LSKIFKRRLRLQSAFFNFRERKLALRRFLLFASISANTLAFSLQPEKFWP